MRPASKKTQRQSQPKIRILCVDDDQELSAMLDLYKKKDASLIPIGTVNNLDKAVEEIEKIRPDIVVLDLSVAGSDPIQTIRRIREQFPKIHVIVYSNEDNKELVNRAMEAGAFKHVHKEHGMKILLDTIYEVVNLN